MNEISIRIFWGPWDGEFNPSPVVSVGNMVGSIVPSAPVLVKEDKSWMIKTDEWKAVYSCHSKERCFNSGNYMQLLVCVILPKGKRLEGEKSPLDLLEDIRNQFDLLFTIDIDSVLPSKEEVEAAFTQVLSNYVVVDCPWYVFNMEGKEPASFQVESRSQLNALMRFNAYPTLAHVEHLELGFKCETTVNISTKGESNGGSKKENKSKWWRREDEKKEAKKETEIEKPAEEKPQIVLEPEKPTPKGYQIMINGQSVKDPTNKEKVKILWEGKDEQYIVRCDSTLDYRYEPLTISIEKLCKAPNATLISQNGNSKAVLDENSHSIFCILNPIAKWYYKEVKYDPQSDADAERYCKENLGGKIRIRVDGQEWNEDKIQPSRVARQHGDGSVEARKDVFSISPDVTEDYQFSVSKVEIVPYKGKDLCIYIKAEKRRKVDRLGGSSNKLTTLWKAPKSYWIVAAIGIALGVAGFWVMQTVLSNSQEKKAQKKAQDEENVAWNSLKDLTPKNPEQAMQFRNYLRKFSKDEITISKGDDSEKIQSNFSYPNPSNIAKAKKKLQTYVNDSIQAERDEEETFEKCKDTTACSNYLITYNPVHDHQYFEKGKHVDAVLKKKSELEWANAAADAQAPAEQEGKGWTKKENGIKNAVAQTALGYLNEKNLSDFRVWVNLYNSEWSREFGESKKNKDLLGKEKVTAIELILDYRHRLHLGSGIIEKTIEKEIHYYLEEEFDFPNKPFKSWKEVTKAKREIDRIVEKEIHRKN